MSRWERCKLCGSPDLTLLHDLPRVEVRVVRCRPCGFAFVEELYDERRAALLYSEVLGRDTEYDRYEAGKEARAAERTAEIAALLGRAGCEPLKGVAVLDVGAGGGSFLAAARCAGAEVSGIELSEGARAFALDRYELRLDHRPLEDPFWGEGSVDVLTLWDVLEHIQDPARAIARAARVLKPGGLLALATPARDSSLHALASALHRASLGRVDLLLRHRYNRLHLQAFRRTDLERLLVARGLRLVRLIHRLDLSYPPRWYFREALGATRGGEFLAALSSLALALVPLKNKIIAHAMREAGPGGGSGGTGDPPPRPAQGSLTLGPRDEIIPAAFQGDARADEASGSVLPAGGWRRGWGWTSSSQDREESPRASPEAGSSSSTTIRTCGRISSTSSEGRDTRPRGPPMGSRASRCRPS